MFCFTKKNKTKTKTKKPCARVHFAPGIGGQAGIQRNESGTDKLLPLKLHPESQHQASIALMCICELCALNLMHYCTH